MKMTEKQRNIVLLSHILAEMKTIYKKTPIDVIPNYNQDKIFELTNSLFPNSISEDDLIKLSNDLYRKLKIR